MIKIPGDNYSQRSKLNDVGQTPGRKGTTGPALCTRTTERSSRENNTVRVLNRAHLRRICRFSPHTRFLLVNSNGSSLWYLLQLLQQEQGSIKVCVQLNMHLANPFLRNAQGPNRCWFCYEYGVYVRPILMQNSGKKERLQGWERKPWLLVNWALSGISWHLSQVSILHLDSADTIKGTAWRTAV